MKIHGGHPYKSTSIMGWCGVFLCWSFFRSSNINYFRFRLCLKDARHIYIYNTHAVYIYIYAAYLCLQSLYTYKVYRQYIYIQYFPLYKSVYILYVYCYTHHVHTHIYIYSIYRHIHTHTHTPHDTHCIFMHRYIYIYIPRTQMTLVLLEEGLVLEG